MGSGAGEGSRRNVESIDIGGVDMVGREGGRAGVWKAGV